eukprot:7705042-Ditylum_brightwellii.AAC.1
MEMFQVTYDSANREGFMVHKLDGTIRCFKRYEKGIFYSVMNGQETVLVNAAEGNKSKYYNHYCSRTLFAQKIQAQIR